ncbi:AI-2E family transporter, partial [Photobacterium sanctipauli]
MSTQRYSLTLPARKENLDLFIKAGLLLVIGALCFQILQPFLLPMVWGGIIAIALNPLVNLIRRRFGLSRGKSSAVITATVLAALIIPTVWFSGAAFTTTQALATSMADGSLVVPQPAAGVAEWPIVGEPLHKAWSLAATNLAGAVDTYAPQLKSLATSMVAAIGSLGG